MRVSRDLFQAILSDHTSLEAFCALVYACDLAATPGIGQAETTHKILRQKYRVSSLLRKRLETGEPASDQIIMTIFFLLTFDVSKKHLSHQRMANIQEQLFDDIGSLARTWDVHLRAIAQLVEMCKEGQLTFRPHLKTRTKT